MKNMPLYKRYAETEPCGFYCICNWGGLEILDIDACEGEYGTVVACYNFGSGRQQIRHHKIQVTTAGRPFIRKRGIRYYLDQIEKC